MATKNKKMAQADSIGDAVVLKKLEEILGCGPGEDVLVRAENLQRELRVARADIETKDVAGNNLMDEMKEARSILLMGREDNTSTLSELCTEIMGAYLRRGQETSAAIAELETARAEYSEQVARLNSQIETADLQRQIEELRSELNDERHNLTEFGRAVLRGEITVIFPAPQ